MKQLTATLVVCSLLLVTACGRVQNKNYNMSEGDALDILASTPRGYTPKTVVTMQGLEDLIVELVESGQVELPDGTRSIIRGSSSMSQLGTLLNLLSQTQDLAAVAQGMISANQGSQSKAKFSIDRLILVMQTVLPLISAFAPQFAVVAQAVMAILPSIQVLIESFKKPSGQASLVPAHGSWMHPVIALVGVKPYRV